MLTVGSTDSQDATIGLDGKLLPDSGVELPAKPEDRPATARMFYTAYFAKDADQRTRPIVFLYNGGPGIGHDVSADDQHGSGARAAS